MSELPRKTLPHPPRYGAIELKRYYRTYFIRALIIASAAHLSLVGIYWLTAPFRKKEPQAKVIRITKYNELIPLITQIEKEYSDMLSSERKGAEWSGGGANGEGIVGVQGNGSGPGSGFRQAERSASSEARRIARETLSREVSQKGLLGLLEASGYTIQEGGGSGGEEITRDDLEKMLSSIGDAGQRGAGSGTGTGSGGSDGGSAGGLAEAKGIRSSRDARIDDVVSGERGVQSESISRKGELQAESPSEVGGQGYRNANRSQDAIQKVLLEHVPAIRYCYERELKRNPELKGKVTVRITVGPDGSVKEANIAASTLNDERVERCILSRTRMWKDFPAIDPGEGDVTFKQVYSFGY